MKVEFITKIGLEIFKQEIITEIRMYSLKQDAFAFPVHNQTQISLTDLILMIERI